MHSFLFRELQLITVMQLLHELAHMVHFSKSVWGIYHFRFHLVFIKVYIFIEQNAWILWF